MAETNDDTQKGAEGRVLDSQESFGVTDDAPIQTPAQENTSREPEHSPVVGRNSGEGERPSPEEFGAWIVQQIQTLSENQQALNDTIIRMQGNQYEAVRTAENPRFEMDFSGWEKVPDDLRKAILGFVGDIGAAARAFAGGGDADSDLEMLKEVIKLDREATRERRRTRITTIMRAMTDPDEELYSIKPKKLEDPKIKKEDATKVG